MRRESKKQSWGRVGTGGVQHLSFISSAELHTEVGQGAEVGLNYRQTCRSGAGEHGGKLHQQLTHLDIDWVAVFDPAADDVPQHTRGRVGLDGERVGMGAGHTARQGAVRQCVCSCARASVRVPGIHMHGSCVLCCSHTRPHDGMNGEGSGERVEGWLSSRRRIRACTAPVRPTRCVPGKAPHCSQGVEGGRHTAGARGPEGRARPPAAPSS